MSRKLIARIHPLVAHAMDGLTSGPNKCTGTDFPAGFLAWPKVFSNSLDLFPTTSTNPVDQPIDLLAIRQAITTCNTVCI